MQSNTINSTSQAAVNIYNSCNPGTSGYSNNFTSNTVNEACMTALVNPALIGANTIGSNSAYNDVYDVLYGVVPLAAGTCGAAPALRQGNASVINGAPGLNFDSPRFHPPF